MLPVLHTLNIVSIRAPVMGAISQSSNTLPSALNVSIRAPVMGAITEDITVAAGAEVSIRAPVMGAMMLRDTSRN